MLISSGIGYLILRFIAVPGSAWNLILCCVIYLAVYAAVMWLMGMNGYEKDMVKKIMAKLARKKAA